MAQIATEVDKARLKHNCSYERMTSMDKRLRIMVEEVGEVARAIEDIGGAQRAYDAADLATLGEFEAHLASVQAHLDEEIAQVGACCQRWLSANAYARGKAGT